jgi:hypothetical protein
MPISISDPEVLAGIQDSVANNNPYVGVFLRKEAPLITELSDGIPELITDLSEIHKIGTFAKVHGITPIPDQPGGQVMLLAHRRIELQSMLELGPPLRLQVNHLERQPFDANDDSIKAYTNEIINTLREVVKLNPLFKEHMQYFSQRIDIQDPYKLADFAASVTTADQHALQVLYAPCTSMHYIPSIIYHPLTYIPYYTHPVQALQVTSHPLHHTFLYYTPYSYPIHRTLYACIAGCARRAGCQGALEEVSRTAHQGARTEQTAAGDIRAGEH